MKVTPTDIPTPDPQSEANGFDLLDLAVVFAKHKTLTIGVPFVCAVLAAVISLVMPNIYTATTKILPPQPAQSAASALLGQLGGLAGLAGAAGIKNPNDLYVGMLRSRTVADNLIERFDLKNLFHVERMSQARQMLEQQTSIVLGRDSIITIEVDDKDPSRAAELANAYVDELFKLTAVLAVTESSQRRLFFERQFAHAKNNLDRAQVAARQALARGGLVKVDEQGRAMVETTARLRAQISAKEVQIGAMRAFATEGNPERQLAQQELEALKRQVAKIEGTGTALAPDSTSGGKGIGNLDLLRDVKYYETMYELLGKQYELAKIDEAKEAAVIQVIDKAVEPDRKSKPRRALIVLFSGVAALLAGILAAFAREALERVFSDPRQAGRLQALRRALVRF